MNAEIKIKWCEKLRSGEYVQGRGFLRCDNKYCVNGVLCDLHAKATESEWMKNVSETNLREKRYSYLDSVLSLPLAVKEWAGITENYLCVEGRALSSLNDEGVTFLELANLIEENL